jgi:hypothetical protein
MHAHACTQKHTHTHTHTHTGRETWTSPVMPMFRFSAELPKMVPSTSLASSNAFVTFSSERSIGGSDLARSSGVPLCYAHRSSKGQRAAAGRDGDARNAARGGAPADTHTRTPARASARPGRAGTRAACGLLNDACRVAPGSRKCGACQPAGRGPQMRQHPVLTMASGAGPRRAGRGRSAHAGRAAPGMALRRPAAGSEKPAAECAAMATAAAAAATRIMLG